MPALAAALRPAGLLVAALATMAGLTLIWIARLSADRYLYVSELGATGEPIGRASCRERVSRSV